MIKHIIFDLGQVLLLQKPIEIDLYLSEIFRTDKSHAHAFYFKHRRDLITGMISSIDLLTMYKNITNDHRDCPQLLDLYVKSYLSDYIGINHELIGYIVEKIKPNYGVHIFTNTIDCHDAIAKKLGIYVHFNSIFKSYTDHIFKPELESYLYCCKKLGAKPEECVFVDDLEENINGAEQAGLIGVIFKDNAQFISKIQPLLNNKN